MHILVIGGAGYIGSHVVKELLQHGMQVTVFDDMSTGQTENLFPEASFIKGDILDVSALEAAMNGVDGVVHLAAKKAVGESMEHPEKYAVNNITGTLNILNVMAKCGVKNFVFSSSAAVYGMPQYVPVDEKHPTDPINFYGFTKLEIERFLPWYNQLKGINWIALRYFNAVGYDANGDVKGLEKNPQNLLPIVMETAVGIRQNMKIFGNDYDTEDGTCVRDYIHVSDLASAHWLALDYLSHGGASQSLNLGTGKGISVWEMVKATERLTNQKINYDFAERRAGDPSLLVAASDTANAVLGWKPVHSDLDNIIRTTWAMYQK